MTRMKETRSEPARRSAAKIPKTSARPAERMWSVKELADRWDCSERTVRQEMASGALPTVRIGPGGRLRRVLDSARRTYEAERWS